MENRLVNFRSTSTGKVIIHEPAYNIHREFPNYGSVQRIPYEIVEQLLWSNGFKNLLEKGFIYIDNMQDKIDLGLEAPDTKEPTRYKVLNDGQIITLLKVRSLEDFKKEIDTLPAEQIARVVDYAIKNNIVDFDKANYLKDVTGTDILSVIAMNRSVAEAEKAEKAEREHRNRE